MKNMEYDSMEADNFEKALEKYKVEDQILKSVEAYEPLGLYLLNITPLKEEIEESAAGSLLKL